MKSEHHERGASEFHGVHGSLNVSDLQKPNEMSLAFVAGCHELGYSLNNDFNTGKQEGFGLYQVTIKDGQRCSSARAFLDPAKNRKNLVIKTYCLASKELESFVRQHGTHIYHPVGTYKMGNDETSIVNHRLQVHNIKGLRIADASIMPSIINANTNAPSIMIGEKCATMILETSS